MLARRLPGILPPLTREEALEVTRIHSVAGVLPTGRPLIMHPPFRAPHHGVSAAAVVGGGTIPRPGEASLAHRGVLLLDEMPEFPRNVLEALRQPLEDGFVAVSRVGGAAIFPARFALVGTMNMCPCGGRGDPASSVAARRSGSPRTATSCRARCSTASTSSWRCRVRARSSSAAAAGEASAPVRERVIAARARLAAASAAVGGGARVARSRRGEAAAVRRGGRRVARVARTIAALAGSESVEAEHLAEALSYRSPRELPGA